MAPAFEPGDLVLLDPAARLRHTPRPGDVVVARHPHRHEVPIVKRVDHIETDGRLFLVGDDTVESTDSRAFGSLHPSAVLGLVVEKL
jgi:nickel-type superoxide dismutase maturation protease